MLSVAAPLSLRALAATPSRFAHVASAYEAHGRRHDALFDPSRVDDFLAPEFLALTSAVARDPGAALALVRQETREVYSFPMLTAAASESLIEEVEAFRESGLEARRPNSMNEYGLILNDIGLRPSLDALQVRVHVLAQALFPREAANFDDHHAFIVAYSAEEDARLDMHTDDSDVTLNVCLGQNFSGAGLTFCGDVGDADHRALSHRYSHVPGRALLHLGRRRHGADTIASGRRVNLIMWNYCKEWRASAVYRQRGLRYAAEAAAPDALCVSYTHDRDYEAVVGAARPDGHQDKAKKAWCPPKHAEYEGFVGGEGRYAFVDPMHRDLV